MSRIYWDTMLFVYLFEGHAEFGPQVRRIHQKMLRRGDTLCTSMFTVGESLSGPFKRNQPEIAKRLKDYFQSNEIELVPFTWETAEAYARLRSENSILPADAIHLASAADARSDLFLTNDHKLQRLRVPGIQFIAGLDGKLF